MGCKIAQKKRGRKITQLTKDRGKSKNQNNGIKTDKIYRRKSHENPRLCS